MFVFFKQKTAYERRISDWSSDVCSSDLSDCASAAGSGFLNAINLFTGTSPESGGYLGNGGTVTDADGNVGTLGGVGVTGGMPTEVKIGRASCRERVCQYV